MTFLLNSKDFVVFLFSCRFPVSGHFPYSRDFVIFLFLDTFPFQKCLETGKTTKSREKNHYFQGIWSFFLFPNTLTFKKCLVTGNTTKSLEKKHYFQGIWSFYLFLDPFLYGKCLETVKQQNPLKIMFFFQGIWLLLLFLDTFHIQGDLSFPLFPDTSTELSAAGAKRGVCKCIRTTILSRPAGRRPARA